MEKLSFIFFTIVSIVFNSCVTDADFTIPENLNLAENKEVLKIEEALQETNSGIDAISIKGLKKLFVRGKAVEITSDIVLVGYIASSDRKGNFFKELYIALPLVSEISLSLEFPPISTAIIEFLLI